MDKSSDCLSVRDMARLLGYKNDQQLRYAIRCGRVPAPAPKYRWSDVPILRRIINEAAKLLSQKAAYTLIGSHQREFYDLKRSGKLDGIGTTIGKRRFYTLDDVAKIIELLDEKHKARAEQRTHWSKARRQEQGFFSQTAAAEELGLRTISFNYYRDRDYFPAPTHQCGYLLCYNREEIEAMRQWLALYRHKQPPKPSVTFEKTTE